MNFHHAIIEVAPNHYVLTRQNSASRIWSCGDVRSRSCLSAALVATRNQLVPTYPTIESATRILFEIYPEGQIAGNISFASAVDIRTRKKDLPMAVYIASRDRNMGHVNAAPKLHL